MIATILSLISGNLMEFIGGAGVLLGLIFGSTMTGGRAKRKQAEMKSEMLEDHLKTIKEVRHESDQALVDRIAFKSGRVRGNDDG